jgi:hypothetical protein
MSKKEYHIGLWYRMYKLISLSLSIIFGMVGLVFLVIPENVLIFFNRISPLFGFMESPVQGVGFYLILAVAYMYLVTVLAYLMYKHPENPSFSFLLISGKSASSILSFIIFIIHYQFLIYLTNGIVDGLIAIGVFLLSRKAHRGKE